MSILNYYIHYLLYIYQLLFCIRSLSDEVHKLVEFGSDNDLRAAIALLAQLGGVRLERVVLTTSTSSQSLGVYAIVVLQSLNDRGGTKTREIPVVADVLALDGHIVRVTLDEYVVVLVVLDNLGNLRQRLGSTVVNLVRTTLVEHVVSQ